MEEVTKKSLPKKGKSDPKKESKGTKSEKKTTQSASKKIKKKSQAKVQTEAITKESLLKKESFSLVYFSITLVIFSVLGGFIYARHFQPQESFSALNYEMEQPEYVNVYDTVVLTPEIEDALRLLMARIDLSSNDVLMNALKVTDPTSVEYDFVSEIMIGDVIFDFTSAVYLFRPSTEWLISFIQKKT